MLKSNGAMQNPLHASLCLDVVPLKMVGQPFVNPSLNKKIKENLSKKPEINVIRKKYKE